MTLCAAWIRKIDNESELVFATDSCLTGGEKWNSGIKLFELPRKDCLLCFAGSTMRAYPLILNLVSAIRFDNRLSSQNSDLYEALDYITELFTELCNQISDTSSSDNIHDLRSEAEFLFGGWSWKKQSFCIWRIFYSNDLEGFTFESVNMEDTRVYQFIGDKTEDAEKLLEDELRTSGRLMTGTLDLEPLKVIASMARDDSIREIDGALQVAKVYKSGGNEFFGVFHQGKHSFLGRFIAYYNKPDVRYYDPDTAELIQDSPPIKLLKIDKDYFDEDFDFVESCYNSDNTIKEDLTEQDKEKLLRIFRKKAYEEFLEKNEKELSEV